MTASSMMKYFGHLLLTGVLLSVELSSANIILGPCKSGETSVRRVPGDCRDCICKELYWQCQQVDCDPPMPGIRQLFRAARASASSSPSDMEIALNAASNITKSTLRTIKTLQKRSDKIKTKSETEVNRLASVTNILSADYKNKLTATGTSKPTEVEIKDLETKIEKVNKQIGSVKNITNQIETVSTWASDREDEVRDAIGDLSTAKIISSGNPEGAEKTLTASLRMLNKLTPQITEKDEALSGYEKKINDSEKKYPK